MLVPVLAWALLLLLGLRLLVPLLAWAFQLWGCCELGMQLLGLRLQAPWTAMCGRSAFFLSERRVNLGLFLFCFRLTFLRLRFLLAVAARGGGGVPPVAAGAAGAVGRHVREVLQLRRSAFFLSERRVNLVLLI